MDVESIDRARKKAAEGKVITLPRVGSAVLGELLCLKEDALVLSMKAQEAEATFRRRVAEVCRELNAPIDQSVICLGCGSIRSTREERCPACTG